MNKSKKMDSVECLFRNRNKDFLRYLKFRSKSVSESEDMAQEAYIRFLRISRKELIHDPEAYLFRVAANVAYEFSLKLRKKNNISLSELDDDMEIADDFSVEDAVHNQQRLEKASLMLSGLSSKCRAAFILHKRDGFTYDEIAARLGVSSSMVKKYLATALVHCQRELSKD